MVLIVNMGVKYSTKKPTLKWKRRENQRSQWVQLLPSPHVSAYQHPFSPLIPPQFFSVLLSHPPPLPCLTTLICWLVSSVSFGRWSTLGFPDQSSSFPFVMVLPSHPPPPLAPSSLNCNSHHLLQGMPKRVAKPTSNIKHLLLSKAGSSNKKKKQVQKNT